MAGRVSVRNHHGISVHPEGDTSVLDVLSFLLRELIELAVFTQNALFGKVAVEELLQGNCAMLADKGHFVNCSRVSGTKLDCMIRQADNLNLCAKRKDCPYMVIRRVNPLWILIPNIGLGEIGIALQRIIG